MDVINSNSNMSGYFRSSTNREADKKASQLIIQRIYNDFIDVFIFRNWVLQEYISIASERGHPAVPGLTYECSICTLGSTQGRAGMGTEAADHSTPGCRL